DLDALGHVVGHAAGQEDAEPAHKKDLVVIEDVQLLSAGGVEPLVQLIDGRLAQRRPTLLTSRLSPQALGQAFPARLTSRLANGLVIALEPLQAPRRLLLLEESCQRRQLAVPADVLRWLADNLVGGGRVLHGCVTQLDALSRLNSGLDMTKVARHFREQVEASRPTVERIAQRVGGHFGVETRQLQSPPASQRALAEASRHVPGAAADRGVPGSGRRLLRRPRSHDGAARLPQGRGHDETGRPRGWGHPPAACRPLLTCVWIACRFPDGIASPCDARFARLAAALACRRDVAAAWLVTNARVTGFAQLTEGCK